MNIIILMMCKERELWQEAEEADDLFLIEQQDSCESHATSKSKIPWVGAAGAAAFSVSRLVDAPEIVSAGIIVFTMVIATIVSSKRKEVRYDVEQLIANAEALRQDYINPK